MGAAWFSAACVPQIINTTTTGTTSTTTYVGERGADALGLGDDGVGRGGHVLVHAVHHLLRQDVPCDMHDANRRIRHGSSNQRKEEKRRNESYYWSPRWQGSRRRGAASGRGRAPQRGAAPRRPWPRRRRWRGTRRARACSPRSRPPPPPRAAGTTAAHQQQRLRPRLLLRQPP